MEAYRCVRCLFCRTGQEEAVVKAIDEKGWGRAIFPKRVKTLRKGKRWTETFTPLLPGYVFVYSDEGAVRYDELIGLRQVIRVLVYGETAQDVLTGRDRAFADWLWQLNGQIGVMKALQVGDRIEIVDGIFKQLNGSIAQMDRRRRTVRVELNTEGSIKSIWLAYDVVEKRNETEVKG